MYEKEMQEVTSACRICNMKMELLIEWNLPFPAELHSERVKVKKHPLKVCRCKSCGHIQLEKGADDSIYDDYLYTPSYSEQFRDYIETFIDKLDYFYNEKGNVVEIGSSNGYLLQKMKERGYRVLGYEPSETLSKDAEKDGVETICKIFSEQSSRDAVEKMGRIDIVILRHVLEHLDDLNGIIGAIANILAKSGMLVIEVPYCIRIMKEKQFYAFFHEHTSYFSLTAIKNLLEPYDFSICHVEENDLEGGSILVFASRKGRNCEMWVEQMIKEEKEYLSELHVKKFIYEIQGTIYQIHDFVKSELEKGKKIAGWGAGQRGVMCLNMCGLDYHDLEYIVDINPNYWKRYLPGSGIRVVSPSWFREHPTDDIIVFATGYIESIISENKKYLKKKGYFIQILPTIAYRR